MITVKTPEEKVPPIRVVKLNGIAGGKRFDVIGAVNSGGASSVLLKDYPEPRAVR